MKTDEFGSTLTTANKQLANVHITTPRSVVTLMSWTDLSIIPVTVESDAMLRKFVAKRGQM